MKSILLLLVFLFWSLSSLLAQDGALDLTFNSTGEVTTSLGSGYDYGKSVAIQSDGKIVVVGSSNNGANNDFAVVRYNVNGSLDTGFGSGGKVTTAIGSFSDVAYSVAIQTDGKIVVAGVTSNGNSNDVAVVRYNTDGTLDTGFGTGGKVVTAINTNDDDTAYGVAIQSDGKIVVAGSARLNGSLGGNYDFLLIRYNTNGTLDTGFDTDGIVTTDFNSATDQGNSIVIQSDGKIVVAGYSGINRDFAVARYNSNGTLDNTFDTDGKVTTAIGTATDVGNSVIIQSDGKIVVAGYAHIGSTDDFAVVRYNGDGSLDTSFDTDGKVTTAIGTSSDWGYSAAIQSDGKILVAGYASVGSNNITVVRYNSNGSLDNTFDIDGKVTTAVGSVGSDGVSIAIQSDGKIVVAGDSYVNFNDADFAVVRYSNSLPVVGSICGMKFNDLNGNGVKDQGEPGLPNWEISIKNNNAPGSYSLMTDADGKYCFTNLAAGTYRISENPQSGWSQTYPASPGIYSLTLSSGQNLNDINFGNKATVTSQGDACLTWDLLSSTAVSATSGNIIGQPETISGGSSAPLMSIFSPYIANGQKLGVTGGWLPGGLDLQRFIEFKVAPTSGNSLNVTSISFNYGDNPQLKDYNILNSQVFYSIDGTNWTQLGGTLSYLNTTMTTFTINISGGVQLSSSQTFSLRIYPYSPSGSVAATISFAVHNHVVICGTTKPEVITPGSICGMKFNDLNGNGVMDSGETGLSGWTISLTTQNAAGPVTVTATTDATGNYCFNNLLTGKYTVSETQQSGWTQTFPGTPGTYSVTLTAGQNLTAQNFGNKQLLGSICGMKFNDLNGNGVMDSGETGLSGWTISLTTQNAAGPVTLTATTDATGNYCFNSLLAGKYTVSETQQSGWTQTFPATPGTYSVTLTAGQNLTAQNFGNKQLLGSICGMKFNDLNGNGVMDSGETGLSGWTISLTYQNATGPVTVTATTDATGNYCFNNLLAGKYTVSETQQNGWTQTYPASPGIYDLALISGQNLTDINFGNKQLFGSICGMKFNDLNGNGVMDLGETGLSGWTISLTTQNAAGPVTLTATTDATGNYCFNNLQSGSYTVSETQQNGWTQTFPATPGTYSVTLTAGQNLTAQNFGNKQLLGSICGMKFNDLNGNGIKDANEPGIPNWGINMKYNNNPGSLSLTTDADGKYCFTNLAAGAYRIIENAQNGWTQTYPASPGIYDLALISGQNLTDINFGNKQLFGSICGMKFNDLNGNGVMDLGETGLSGWTISLTTQNAAGPVTLTATTDATGNYCFNNLLAGKYTVSETQQNGWTQTFPATPGIYSVTLTAGQNLTAQNFGNKQLLGSICGMKFNDLNGNGVMDSGETGLSGWTISLTYQNAAGPVTLTATTDATGNYCFNNLLAGKYTVSETQQSGWTQTFPGTPGIYSLTLTSGQNLNDINFGNKTTVTTQGDACLTWDLLSSTAVSTTSGNIIGQPETISGGSSAPLMSIFSPYIANGQKLGVTGGWLPGGLDLQRFIEFKVAPTSGNSLNVTSISFNYGDNPQLKDYNILNSQVFYSIDGTNWTQLGGTLSYLNTTMTTFTMNISGGVQLSSSQTFSLRIYPYSPSGSVAATISFAVHNHVVICGTTSKEQSSSTVTPGGPDQVCQSANPAAITLSGASVGGSATMGAWSITSGGGTLSSTAQTATPASVTYTPAANYSGTVILKLTTNSTPAVSATRTITIIALPPAPGAITGTFTLCVGSTTQLADVTGGGTWTSGSTGVATVNASTGLVTGISAGTALITYTIASPVTVCTNSVTQTVTVGDSPTISGTTPAARCGAGTVTLEATASSGTINWYAASTGGSPLGTGTTFTTPVVSATTTYYVDATSGGCTTTARTAVVATVNAIPTITATTPGSVCGTGTATLGATASSGTINWYAASTGGSSLGTGTSFTTPVISSATSYWVDATNNTCTSARTQVLVTVNKIPTVATTVPAARCGAGTVTLGATASSGTINWYAASTGGSALGTGTTFTTPIISATTTYYVDAASGGCTTAARTAVVATINPLPVVSAPASVIVGSTITLSPTTGGTWISNNPLIASVTNAGVVTGISAGTATFTFTNSITGCSATTSSVSVTTIVSTPCIYLCNPDFEQFSGVTPPSGFSWIPQTNIPCWKTTASDGLIEIWHSGYGSVPAHSGNYFAELNATQVGTLYQDFAATAPQTVIASFWHRGRYAGADVMKVSMVAPNGTITLLGTYSDNNAAWNFYSTATYPITVTGTYTLKFESVSSNNGTGPRDGGNFLDDINVTCPSSICGIKYNDLNGDGQKQATEPVLSNWEIKLTGPLTMTATTGVDGSYCFNNLPAGTYSLEETQQSGWVQTAPANPGTHSVNLIEGQKVVGKDFGNRQLTNSSCIDFEDGTNGGWQVNNLTSSIATDGTNHYIHTTDQSGASSLFDQSKPLVGNYTDLLVNGCGSLCYDVNFLFAGNPFGGVNPPSTFSSYIAIAGNGFMAYFLINNPIQVGSGWHSFCAPLAYLNLDGTLPSNADGQWVMVIGSNSDWNSLLSNVTRVHLPADPTGFQGEQFGYDNICLKNTGDCITLCCDKVTVTPVLDATGKPTCSAKIAANCEVRSIDVTVSNGTLSTATWNCPTSIPTGYQGLNAYTFVPGSCIPELTTSVNAITSGIVTITYDITFSSGEKCRKTIEVDCGAPCCEQVKVEPVINAAGNSNCSAKITANCEVKSIAVTVTNGKLNSVNWNCPTAIPTGYIGLSTYSFAPGSCNPEMTTSVDAIASGIVTITYDITFANGEKCQKKVDLDCSVPLCCDQVKVEPVVDATGKASCCAKITATCEVKSLTVSVANGKLSSVNWNCKTPIPSESIGKTTFTFAPDGCIPVMTTCVDAIKSGMVTITYDIVFANGEKCQKTVRLDCAVAAECVTPPSGMVLWLPGDGNSFDISGLNNHGTLSGGATYSTGKVANAFRVGKYVDYISVPDNSSLNFGTGNFSADAWINTTDNIHFISIADKSVSAGNNMIGYRLFIIQGKLYFQMGDGSMPLSQWVSTVQLADGAWHFVGVTIDRKATDGGKLYIDGSVALTFDPTTKPGSISNTIPLTVAGNNMVNYTASDHYTFYLDEVELFNRVITEAEFASIYNAGSAGKCKLGSICGTKFNDLNGNGRRDKDEPGIPEWKITIGGTADLTTYTDRDGNYCFYNLEPGEYKIGEEVRTGWQQIVPAKPGTYTLSLPAGQNLTGLDFGNRLIPQTGSICGSKFNDLNGNGRRDVGEPGIGDWTILLGGGATDLKVTTDRNGDFCFDNLKPGEYKLGEESRVGWLQMKPTSGTYNIVLTAGQMIVGQDFGNMLDSRPASICGIKFNDLNGNGTQDSNEPGLPNWTISLTGSATMTAVTDRKGNYCFTGLKPGTYTISEVNQPLWNQTAPRPTGNYSVTLTAGQYLENLNFGNQHEQECVTPPILMLGWWPGDDNANDITLNGNYGTLVNGATYAPGKVDKAFSLMGSTDYVNIPDRPQLNPGNGDFTIDAWIQTSEAKGTFSILDKRGYDANQNISGYGLYVVDGHLQLRLSDSAGNGLAAALYNDNTTLIADGQWHLVAATVEQGSNHRVKLFIDGIFVNEATWGFPILNYSNSVDLRIGEAYFSTYSNNSPVGHYHNFQGMIDEVEFLYGARSEAELAGIYNAGSAGKCKPAVQLGSICGSKFNDLNGNGIRDARGDGEPGLANWTIKLTGAANMTTTTDANGNFCFNNLPAGQYTIAEVNQSGWIQTAPLNPNTFTVSLKPGEHIEFLNFGNKVDPTVGCVSPPSGMVLWLSGDGHARDLSGLNNHGTLNGGVGYGNGKVDQAFMVNTTSTPAYISVPDNSSLNFGTGNFSIDGWVKTKNNYMLIAQKIDAYFNFSSINMLGYWLFISQGQLCFSMGQGGSVFIDKRSPSFQFSDNKWHFVAVTVDRKSTSGGKMYIDGNVVMTFDPTSVPNSISNNKDLYLFNSSNIITLAGDQIDELEIFNRSITGAEIASIYNAGSSGKCKLGSICGMKFNDLNGNGRKDDGEPGIAGWQINLGGTTDLSVKTEKDGSFCFTNLNPGEYRISEEVRDGWKQTAPGSQGTFTVTLPAGRNITGYNFGNNYQNPTSCVEPPSGMVAWWAFDETSGTTATDFAGYNNSGTLINGPLPVPAKVLKGLQFDGVNDYVEVPNQAELNFGTGDFSFDAWIKTSENIGVQMLVSKRSSTGYAVFLNSGYLGLTLSVPSIAAMSWSPSVFVADGNWHHIAVTVSRTDKQGIVFYLDGVATPYGDPTQYQGSLTNSASLMIGTQQLPNPSFNFKGILDEVELFNRVITKAEIVSIFTAGSSGKCKLGSICGTKYNDLNGNGRRDVGEPGIPDWMIMLDGTAKLTAITDKEGNYCFTNLVAGGYKVVEELRPEWQQKAPAEGYYGVNLFAGQNIKGRDFGNMLNSQLGSICGVKYNDLNGNGKRDKDEPGIPDWTILIGGTADFRVQTDKNGEYCLNNLKPGVYKIGEQLREGWIQTAPSERYFSIELKEGQHVTNLEFGNMLDPKTGSICGMKFNDVNGNGIMDNGEQAIPDWTINLSGPANLTIQTDKSGNYCFTRLPSGNYTISEGSSAGWYQTAPKSGTYSFTLKPGESVDRMNFGNRIDPCFSGMKSWLPLGSGIDNILSGVQAIAMIGNDLYVAGWFTSAGGVNANNIAKWNGTSWTALGSGLNDEVNALAVIGTDLYAGGRFTTAGGVSANRIAKWNGTNWTPLGSGFNHVVFSLAVMGGKLYAGGVFSTAGGISANSIAAWNGTNWSALGSGLYDSNQTHVFALEVIGSDLYAGGQFITAGGVSANRIAKWNGSSWSALNAGLNSDVWALKSIGSDLYVGGSFTSAGGISASRIAKWDGTNWSALGTGLAMSSTYPRVNALTSIGSDLYVGGIFSSAGGINTSRIAKWDGANWSAPGTGFAFSTIYNPSVSALYANGSDLYAGGWFDIAGSVSAKNIAKYSCDVPNSVGKTNLQQPYELDQNYPNPFNSTTTIGYSIPQTSFVNISVYDIYGKEIKVLVNEEKDPGHHEIVFDRRDFVSGIYFYTLKTAGFIQSKKMIIMK